MDCPDNLSGQDKQLTLYEYAKNALASLVLSGLLLRMISIGARILPRVGELASWIAVSLATAVK